MIAAWMIVACFTCGEKPVSPEKSARCGWWLEPFAPQSFLWSPVVPCRLCASIGLGEDALPRAAELFQVELGL